MTPEQGVFAGATAVFMVALAGGMPRPDRRALGHPAVVGAAGLFLLSLIVRAFVVRPTLVHADVVAPEVVDCVLQFPRVCTTRGASYGQYGFLVLGGLTRLFGSDLSAVFRAVQLVGAVDIVLLAGLGYRLSGSPYGALLVVALTGTNPIFMRVAASEDMHNMGLCLGLIGFIAMDVFAVTRRTAALLAAVLALCLMVHTRQTFHVFVPCVLLLGVARGGRDLLTSGRFWAAGVAVTAVLALQVVGSAGSGNVIQNMRAVFEEPVLLRDLLGHHALLDVTRFGPLPVLTVAALIWACSSGGVAGATAIVFAANFLVTYPCGMPSPGVELAQRLPAVAFGMLLVAMAGAALLESRVGASRRVVAGLLAAGVLAALPPLFPGWETVRTLTPIHREYLAVEAAAAALPREFTLVTVPTADAALHGNVRYAGVLARAGKRVHVASVDAVQTMPRPWLFLENVECWTYSFRELTGITDETAARHQSPIRWDHVLFGRQRSPLRPPAGARPECRPILRDSAPTGPRTIVSDPEDDPPFLFYSARGVPVGFHELRPTAAE
jgi:hypothetical protein